ncbi:MAG: hypothetical protein KGR69_11075 [Verrucomicrobia bacterium]|nr:hypothetical protein [Verrucomicrobiota bacterium]
MSEGEYTTIFKTIENIVGRVCDTAVEMEKLRGTRRSSVTVSEPHEKEKATPKTTVAEDNDDRVEASKVVKFRAVERPDGAEVGRGDNRGMEAPPEAALPAQVSVDDKQLKRGKVAFEKLVNLWLTNFGVEGAEQPDRAEAMRNLANGPKSFAVLAYVKAAGGLTWAVNAAFSAVTPESARRDLVLNVAGNITQVASILFPDLSDLYEYKDIFVTPEEDNDE